MVLHLEFISFNLPFSLSPWVVVMEAGCRCWTWDAVAQGLWLVNGLLLPLLHTASLLHAFFFGDLCVCLFSILKFLLNLPQFYFCFLGVWFLFCFFFCHSACEILVPQSEIEATSPALEGKVLTTGMPDKPLSFTLETYFP